MTEANLVQAWDHTVFICAAIRNANCSKTSELIRDPISLNPVRRAIRERSLARQPDPPPEEVARLLVDAFVRA